MEDGKLARVVYFGGQKTGEGADDDETGAVILYNNDNILYNKTIMFYNTT